jgi:hypothetical protein
MSFVVMRHTETGGVGAVAAEAVDLHRVNGWIRVSDYRGEPGDFHLPDYSDAPDLDAPPQHSPAVTKPDTDEEQQA